MLQVNIYLNFDGTTEAAFNFYKSVLGGEFTSFQRMGDAPGTENLSAEEKNRVMHVALPVGNTVLMATDTMESMGHHFKDGNRYTISLQPDSEEEAHRLFNGLSAGGNAPQPLEKMFWGALWGSFTDKYGVQWMINYEYPKG